MFYYRLILQKVLWQEFIFKKYTRVKIYKGVKMIEFILEQLNKIGNRLKGRAEHKNRLKYTKHDVFTSMIYEDFNKSVIALKLPHIAKLYNLDLG